MQAAPVDYRRRGKHAKYAPWLKTRLGASLEAEDPYCDKGPDPFEDWVDSQEVLTAWHISEYASKPFESCSNERTHNFTYTNNYDDSQPIYDVMKAAGVRILKYSGDVDGVVATIGTVKWINEQNWDILEAWRPYFYGGQVAGYIEERDGLTFATVRGAGHEVPQYKRAESYYMIFNWLNQQPI